MSQGMQIEKLWLNGKNGKNGKRNVVFEFSGRDAQFFRKNYHKGRAQANVLKIKQNLNELKDRMFNLMRSAPTAQAPAGQEEKRNEYETRQFISQ